MGQTLSGVPGTKYGVPGTPSHLFQSLVDGVIGVFFGPRRVPTEELLTFETISSSGVKSGLYGGNSSTRAPHAVDLTWMITPAIPMWSRLNQEQIHRLWR